MRIENFYLIEQFTRLATSFAGKRGESNSNVWSLNRVLVCLDKKFLLLLNWIQK
jgi:hypothetical protein